jgi:hypothetical protein
VTLNLAVWLGIPSLSFVTIYRNVEKSGPYIQPYNSNFIGTLQKCLPYWCVLQGLGHSGVVERVKYASDMSTAMTEILDKNKPYLKVLVSEQYNFLQKKWLDIIFVTVLFIFSYNF